MKTSARRWILRLTGGVAAVAVVFAAGYLSRWSEWQPLHGFANRVERKVIRGSSEMTETEKRVNLVETTFLRLRGEVWPMPRNNWVNGGGMTVRDDELLVVHNSGRILTFEDGVGLRDTDLSVPDNGQSAYRELAQSPEWRDFPHKPDQIRYNDLLWVSDGPNHGFALSYTFFDPDRACYGNRLAWLDLPSDAGRTDTLSAAAADWTILYESSPCLDLNTSGWTVLDGITAGGRMDYGGAGKIILGNGDYHLDGIHTYNAGLQSDEIDYGKVMEIDIATATARQLSKGHRNLQGVAVDNTGRIWVTEHGIRGGDELNLVEPGRNYGWPLESLGTLYSGQPFPTEGEQGRHVLHTPPVYAWLPSAAVSTLTFIDGFDPTWDGDLLAGSLSSPTFGQSLFRIRIRDGRALFVERIELARRVRYVTQFHDRIAVLLDTNELVLFSIEPRLDPLADTIAWLSDTYEAPQAGRIEQAMAACGQCHSYVESDHAGAPSLNGVIGRGIGAAGYENYSTALAGHGGRWDPESLRAFLLNPQTFAPGTTMPDPGLSDDADLTGLIEALTQLNSTDDTHLRYN